MTGLLERRHFLTPLRGIFEEGPNDWFLGFDKMLEDMASTWDQAFEGFTEHPLSKVEQRDDRHFRVTMDVEGFDRPEIVVQRIDDELVVKGHHEVEAEGDKPGREMSFEQRFFLAPGIHVDAAKLDEHELVIDVSFPETATKAVEEIAIR